MAADNKTIGRFELTDIPPAPRGIPQIEVTFDLDANGILHVSAKDLGTGKEQSIRITASSGLSEQEIKRMQKDADLHADEDKKRRELIESKNHADSMIYATEKSLKEVGDKVDAATRGKVESEIANLKKVMEGSDAAAIKSATESLTQASHKLAEVMYSQATKDQQPGGGAGSSTGGGKKGDDDVVDADFEEVK
jgi:molecular chaperone DnaK